MHRTEAQFCRDEAGRLLELAKECDDPQVRDHLAVMANEWLDRAMPGAAIVFGCATANGTTCRITR
jgi:hypothetical protein